MSSHSHPALAGCNERLAPLTGLAVSITRETVKTAIIYLTPRGFPCIVLCMMRKTEPTSLQEAIVYFSNPDNCISYLVERRWPDGVITCPNCGSDQVTFMPKRRLWQCKGRHSKAQFSIKVGTIFEDSPIGLDKW